MDEKEYKCDDAESPSFTLVSRLRRKKSWPTSNFSILEKQSGDSGVIRRQICESNDDDGDL